MRLTIGLLAMAWLAACGGPDPASVTAELPDESAGITIDLPPDPPQTQGAPQPAAAEPESRPPEEVKPAPPPPAAPAEESAAKEEEPPEPTPEQAAPKAPAEEAPAQAAPAAAEASGDASAMTLLDPQPETRVAPWAGHIRRAGFACGGIGSARQLQRPDGKALEVYRIECTSGGTYQGTVKRGRLYFRRWTGRLDRRR